VETESGGKDKKKNSREISRRILLKRENLGGEKKGTRGGKQKA